METQTMKRHLACTGAALLLAAAPVTAADVTFSAKPSAVKAGGGVKISFTVAAPTDVEVAVLDATNGVVRHLAAGVLGGTNAPPEPLKPGLAQELTWDGKDDFGRAISGFGVQVSGPTPDTRYPTPFRRDLPCLLQTNHSRKSPSPSSSRSAAR